MQTNQQFDLAFNLLQNTGTNLFLTAKKYLSDRKSRNGQNYLFKKA